jgi:hypothetical protein
LEIKEKMTDRKKIEKAEKKVWKLLSRLYNKGYLLSFGSENGGYHFTFWSEKIHKPLRKIKEIIK